ncbi:MAG: DedA family protein, partial [Geminicoccaceae bacterium]
MLQALVGYIGDHPNLALLIVFLISAGEALIIVGLFVPSTVVLVGAGTLIGMGKLPFLPIFIATTLGAIAGDSISYWVGHVFKGRVREFWPFNRYTSLLDQGETFFKKHGGKSILIGRFIPGVKAVVPGIAGMVGMNPVRFTAINAISAIAWAAVHVVPAIGLGRGID